VRPRLQRRLLRRPRGRPKTAGVTNPPVACTLRPGEFQDRAEAWRALIDGWLIERERIPGGLRLVFDNRPGVAEAAGELLRLEAECCPWMHSQLEDDDQRLLMELRADQPEAAEALVSLFGSET
jgi:hypothetical protein